MGLICTGPIGQKHLSSQNKGLLYQLFLYLRQQNKNKNLPFLVLGIKEQGPLVQQGLVGRVPRVHHGAQLPGWELVISENQLVSKQID